MLEMPVRYMTMPLEAETEARVTAGAVAAQIEIPPVILLVEAQLGHARGEHVKPLLALRSRR